MHLIRTTYAKQKDMKWNYHAHGERIICDIAHKKMTLSKERRHDSYQSTAECKQVAKCEPS